MAIATDELARWQGQVEARLTDLERRTDGIGDLRELITGVRVDIATLRAQVRFWSAIGGALMAGLVTLVVALLLVGKA